MLYELGDHDIALPGKSPVLGQGMRLILWQDGQIVMNGPDIAWPYEELSKAHELDQPLYVAKVNGRHYFTAALGEAPAGASSHSLRDIAFIGETQFMLCARARAHLEWRQQHKYCGQCAQPVQPVKHEFAMECVPCRLRFYPRISPCIIVLVTNGRKVLLAQGVKHREQGWYSTLAGFIESGESAEQAVIREVKEEVNVNVGNLQYMNSQAWPFPNQLMLGYFAEYQSGEIIPADGEIADAQWFDIENLPKHPPSISIAGWLIRQFQKKCGVV
jgi:NAD+ diphosphatase